MRKKRDARKNPDPDELRPQYDLSNAMPNKYAALYAQGITINILRKGRKPLRIVKSADDLRREAEEFAKRRTRQPMLIVKSPDSEGTRDVCFRDMMLRAITEDSAKESATEKRR